MTENLQALLRDLDIALGTWELCINKWGSTQERFREAQARINEHGGTLAYIAELRERIGRAK